MQNDSASNGKLICRVCGGQYDGCRTRYVDTRKKRFTPSARNDSGVFRWRDVACSPECAVKYLAELYRKYGCLTPVYGAGENEEEEVVYCDKE